MELKDVILSTLAEIEEIAQNSDAIRTLEKKEEPEQSVPAVEQNTARESVIQHMLVREDEIRMLEGIRERLLVLFEGFQSPNNVAIEAKVDLTLNFLEYLLATIDSRLDTIKD